MHSWNIEELENLMPSALSLGTFQLTPEKYKEEWTNKEKELEIHALVSVSAAEHEGLRQLFSQEELVPVVRVGISEEARTMRVISNLWSKADEHYRWLLHLQDPVETKPIAGWFEFGRGNREAPYLLSALEELASVLVAKGIITDDEFKAAEQRARNNAPLRAIDMLQVKDLDRFWDDEP